MYAYVPCSNIFSMYCLIFEKEKLMICGGIMIISFIYMYVYFDDDDV
jgi:hypothetical protein